MNSWTLDPYWEKYFLIVGGVPSSWDCFQLRDLFKQVTERIWVEGGLQTNNPEILEHVQIVTVTVNGRDDAESLYAALERFRTNDGRQLSIHVFDITDGEDATPTHCNCELLDMDENTHALNLAVYMDATARKKLQAEAQAEARAYARWKRMQARYYRQLYPQPVVHTSPPLPVTQSDPFAQRRELSVASYISGPIKAFIDNTPSEVPSAMTQSAQSVRPPAAEQVQNQKPKQREHIVHLSNLDYKTTEQDLKSLFESNGLESALIKKHRSIGHARGYAKVVLPSPEEANSAIARFHKSYFLGRKIKVTKYRGDSFWDEETPSQAKRSSNLHANPKVVEAEKPASNSSVYKPTPPIVNGSNLIFGPGERVPKR